MEDINVRSVRYPLSVDQKFEKLALKLGRTKRQFFIQMVDYFYKSKKDPVDLNDELLKNTLMKNHQQYIGFIKTQENMLLVPMKSLMDRVGESQRQIIDLFNTEVLHHNLDVLNNQHALAAMLSEIAKLMEAILQSQKNKEALKSQFMSILEGFIRARESFTMITSGKEKEELISVVKDQVRSL
ncbi:hypothetical protein ACVW0P_004484 [Mucilaginibacter sp. UYNi724]